MTDPGNVPSKAVGEELDRLEQMEKLKKLEQRDKLNGTALPPPQAPADLPTHRQKQVEAGLASYQAVCAERDRLQDRLNKLSAHANGLEQKIAALLSVTNNMELSYKQSLGLFEQRANQLQKTRDEFADRAISLETTLSNLFTIIRNAITGVGNDKQPNVGRPTNPA